MICLGFAFSAKESIKSVTAFEIEQRRMDVSIRRRCVSYKSVRQKYFPLIVLSEYSSVPSTSWDHWLSGSPSRRSVSSVRTSASPAEHSPLRRSPSDADTASPTGSCCSTVPACAFVDISCAFCRICLKAYFLLRIRSGPGFHNGCSGCK